MTARPPGTRHIFSAETITAAIGRIPRPAGLAGRAAVVSGCVLAPLPPRSHHRTPGIRGSHRSQSASSSLSLGQATASSTRPSVKEQSEMSHPSIHAALTRERQNKLLAEAEAGRLARQARSHRRRRGTSAVRRSPLRRAPHWLPPAWSRLLAAAWPGSIRARSGSTGPLPAEHINPGGARITGLSVDLRCDVSPRSSR